MVIVLLALADITLEIKGTGGQVMLAVPLYPVLAGLLALAVAVLPT